MKKTLKENVRVAAGKLFFAEIDENGNYGGERYLGDSPEFSLSITTEQVEVWSSDGPIGEKMVFETIQVTRSGAFTLNDSQPKNLAMFVIGDEGEHEQEAFNDEVEVFLGVQQGTYLQVGTSVDNPMGVRNINIGEDDVTDGESPANAYTSGDDYEFDGLLGRLYIVPGGGISDGSDIEITFSGGAESYPLVSSSDTRSRSGRLRCVADNTTGTNLDWLMPLVTISPDGDLALKGRTDPIQPTFAIEALKHDDYEAIYIGGRPV